MKHSSVMERTHAHRSSSDKKIGRRQLLGAIASVSAIAPLSAVHAHDNVSDSTTVPTPEDSPPVCARSENYWKGVRSHFDLSPDLRILNAANMSPTPSTVASCIYNENKRMRNNPSFQNRSFYEEEREKTRKAIAQFVGADADEIALVRNTSEGNNIIINGLDLKAQDEVLIWAENHTSNDTAWHESAKRFGFTVKTVETPKKVRSKQDLISAFKGQISARTRLIAFSHISNVTGIHLPAKELVELAKQNNCLTLVDGAQSFGYMPLDLHDMGCDFYTTSGQKWLMGPSEASFLYVQKDRIDEVWPSMVTHGWERDIASGARKFESLGQRDDGRLIALRKAVEFQKKIGKRHIEARINYLTRELRQLLEDTLPQIKFLTTHAQGLTSGILVGAIAHANAEDAARTLYDQYNVAGAIRGNEGQLRFRLCPHICLSLEDIRQTADAFQKAMA